MHVHRFALVATAALMTAFTTAGASAQCETQVIGANNPANADDFGRCVAAGSSFLAATGEVDENGNAIVRIRRRPDLLVSEWDVIDDDAVSASKDLPDGVTNYGSAMAAAGNMLIVCGTIDADGDGIGEPYARLFHVDADKGSISFVDDWASPMQIETDTLRCEAQPSDSQLRVVVGGFTGGVGDQSARASCAELVGNIDSLSHARDVLHQFPIAPSWGDNARGKCSFAWHGELVLMLGPADADQCPDGYCVQVAALHVVDGQWTLREAVTPPAFEGQVLSLGLSSGNKADGPFLMHAVVGEGDLDDDGYGDVRIDSFHDHREGLAHSQTLQLSDNPLYSSSSTTGTNPMYEGLSRTRDGASFGIVGLATINDGRPDKRSSLHLMEVIDGRVGLVPSVAAEIDIGAYDTPWMSASRTVFTDPDTGESTTALLLGGGGDCDDGDVVCHPGQIYQIHLDDDDDGDGVADSCVCRPDLDNSGEVNVSDMLTLLSNWGNGGSTAALAAPKTTTNVSDLLVLLSEWGSCSK